MPRRWPKPRKSARRLSKAPTSRTWRAPNPTTWAAAPKAAIWASSTRPDRALVRGGRCSRCQYGELSQPVKTTYGYHLIKVEERKPTRTFEELRPELEKASGNEASRKFLAELKAKTKIVIDPEFTETSKSRWSGSSSDPNPQTRHRLSAVRLRRTCSTVARPTAATTTSAPDCGTTFEPATTLKGGAVTGVRAAGPAARCHRPHHRMRQVHFECRLHDGGRRRGLRQVRRHADTGDHRNRAGLARAGQGGPTAGNAAAPD